MSLSFLLMPKPQALRIMQLLVR